ncbi:maleylpyruvate isomerase N-terminal domain-containing protein [Nocardia miyunensis]|uniref:maleylpyruvate isomerase N-terminal domain-containing protein n=1 Tax=Nocardia miyunensis TaxID=282684 RepID=UPI000AF63293|nr:maleylpyruvate isomerase N-terminal domain-containing protein [Nocardia miyunensis]
MRTHADSLRWVAWGTSTFTEHAAALDDRDIARPCALPGWTRAHLLAHVAANADALGRLVHWAATGEPTPMYSSPAQRAADIDSGAKLSVDQLIACLDRASRELSAAMAALGEEQWRTEVLTAQGRTVPATQIPWLRAREVCVHAVDLGTGVRFADLPEDFLTALVADIRAKRGLGEIPGGPLPEVAAYLAARPHSLADVPDLGPWL